MSRIEELAAAIDRHVAEDGVHATALPCLQLIRSSRPTAPLPAVYEASLCLIAQGAKEVAMGETRVLYDASRYLLVSVDLPLIGNVTEADADRPYLCCKIDLDRTVLADLMLALPPRSEVAEAPVIGAYPGDPDLTDAACRLVQLLDRPESIPTLAPLIERELLYRLLTGPHGGALREIASGDSRLSQISRAIAWIRDHLAERLRIAEVAAAAGMSASSLHAHFKAVTGMTPLDFQKQLRLQAARQLMLADGANAGSAGFAVGYESPSQFSREYRRLFGAPPRADVTRMLAGGDAASAY
ncbi:AraC family transcriptional regulator [Sphingosinithalassobacter sp. CS137]|uniref:AraC family transcriptional regulator n=1 Tax=Sphingosinithalassobacter sp. CS137 TaxID=2762748 RepID=UPI00165D8430|nr:AraC family transcriptional regulator [Sphingosinithalassobacter sp. CS137]